MLLRAIAGVSGHVAGNFGGDSAGNGRERGLICRRLCALCRVFAGVDGFVWLVRIPLPAVLSMALHFAGAAAIYIVLNRLAGSGYRMMHGICLGPFPQKK